jgi:hypothetical protein
VIFLRHQGERKGKRERGGGGEGEGEGEGGEVGDLRGKPGLALRGSSATKG